ncbi:MAG: hypothetical protein WCK90_02755, partial [archaeon]
SEYENGLPGQITFLSYKSGSTLGALLNQTGIQASRALKRGVSLEDVCAGWLGHKFEPYGLISGHPYVKNAQSPLDLTAKILLMEYLGKTEYANDPAKVKLKDLRGFQNGAFKTLKKKSVDEWDVEQVLKDADLGGFVNGGEVLPQNGNGENGKKMINARGVVCGTCGNAMKQTSPNCFFCASCGDKRGGCGI